MIKQEQAIKWVYVIEWNIFNDERGSFLKTFNANTFKQDGFDTEFKECYFSCSKKNVIRGMHFQSPPEQHTKLVYVSKWEIKDVLLDIRKWSKTYGKFITIELSFHNGRYIYIPKWIAHWFLSLEEETIVNYLQTTCYEQKSDSWILYSSFWYNWQDIENPIVSIRDASFIPLESFDSPFILWENC